MSSTQRPSGTGKISRHIASLQDQGRRQVLRRVAGVALSETTAGTVARPIGRTSRTTSNSTGYIAVWL